MNLNPAIYQLTKEEKQHLRANLFMHLDGFATASAMYVLNKKKLLPLIFESDTVEETGILLSQLCTHSTAYDGYLQVALRALCSQGWLLQTISNNEKDICYKPTAKGKIAAKWAHSYDWSVIAFPIAIELTDYLFKDSKRTQHKEAHFESVVESMRILYKEHHTTMPWSLPDTTTEEEVNVRKQIYTHIEGLLVGPALVSLGMRGFWKEFHPNKNMCFTLQDLKHASAMMPWLLGFLVQMEWLSTQKNEQEITTYTITPKGWFFIKRATAYGVTVSYLPTFNVLIPLIFENPNTLWELPTGVKDELHVNRTMNVWGSGGAHSTYFRKIDEIVIDIFNRPIEQQPKGFADMGCGNGALIEHLFDIIYEHTERGKMLDKHPLFIIGADFNRAALVVTKQNLIDADVWANVEYGDIGKPDLLAQNIRDKYQIELNDLLSVRSFLDHNRIYKQPKKIAVKLPVKTTGAYASRGRRLTASEVEQNLVEHLKGWAPHIKKFGLLVLELHTIDPALAAQNIGKTAVTAYDGTHGYSDQYIVELPVFIAAAKKAGLQQVAKYQAKFPPSELVTVSINLLKAAIK